MIFQQSHKVYRDKLTGVCYSKRHAFKPLALIAGPGNAGQEKVKEFGYVLEPYSGHPQAAWDADIGTQEAEDRAELAGFNPYCFGQDVFVTEAQLAERFECLGTLSQEIDLEATMREYQEEGCDFSDTDNLARNVLDHVQRMAPSLAACQLYALVKARGDAHPPTAERSTSE